MERNGTSAGCQRNRTAECSVQLLQIRLVLNASWQKAALKVPLPSRILILYDEISTAWIFFAFRGNCVNSRCTVFSYHSNKGDAIGAKLVISLCIMLYLLFYPATTMTCANCKIYTIMHALWYLCHPHTKANSAEEYTNSQTDPGTSHLHRAHIRIWVNTSLKAYL